MKSQARIGRNLSYRVVVGSLLLLETYALLLRNVADYDLWGVVSFGALIEQSGFPYRDVFSFTAPNAEWIYHEWGSGVLFYHLLTSWGDWALFVAKVLLFAAALFTAGSIHRAATKSNTTTLPDGVFFVIGLPGCLLLLNGYIATVRCHAFSILGYLLFLWILDTYRRHPDTRAPWLLPIIMAVWGNLHGGFVLGFFALGVHWIWLLWERRKRQAIELGILILFCLGGLLFNPYGLRFVPKIVEAWTMSRAGVGEWGSVWSLGPVMASPYAVLVVITLTASAWNAWRDRRFPGVLLLLLGTGIQGAQHVKLMPFFVFTAMALGVAEIVRLFEGRKIPTRVRDMFGLLMPAGIGTATAVLLLLQVTTRHDTLRPRVPGWNAEEGRRDDGNQYPIGAVSYLGEQEQPIRLWSPFHWGEFIAWTLYPDVKVSMDGRYETLYPESVRTDHMRVWGSDRDLSIIDAYESTHVMVPSDDRGMIEALDNSDWHRIYQDPVAMIYSRQPADALATARSNQMAYVGDFVGDLSRFGR